MRWNQLSKCAVVVCIPALLLVFVSAGTGQEMSPAQQAEAEKVRNAMLELHSAYTDPVDVYMVGSDFKVPTFKGVLMLRPLETPGGGMVYVARDKDNYRIVLNPAQIAATRSVKPVVKTGQ